MSLGDLPVEIATQIAEEICGPGPGFEPCSMQELLKMRLISRQYDAIISRILFPRVNLGAMRQDRKLMTRPIVKWLLLEKAKSLRASYAPGAFAFMLDVATFLAESRHDPLRNEDDYLDAVCRAVVSSNNPKSVFTKLILHATPDPSFYNLWHHRRHRPDQEWTRKDKPELYYGALQVASASGSVRAMESLLASGADLDHRHRVFGTAIHAAILCNQVNIVKFLVEKGIDTVSALDGTPRPLLFFTSEVDRPQIAGFLLGLPNAPVNYKGKGGVTLLLWAARRGWADIVRLLLQRTDVDPDPKTDWKETPLKAAARGGHEDIVRMFTAREDIEPEVGNGKHPLVYYAVNAGSTSIARLLLDRYAIDPNSLVMRNKSILGSAAELGHEAMVRMLLDRDDVDPNHCHSKHHSPPIVWAALANKIETAKMLLQHKDLKLNLEGHGSAVLKKLVTRNHLEMTKLLLDRRDLSPCVVQQALKIVARTGTSDMLWCYLSNERVTKNFKEEREHTVQEAVRAGRDDVLRKLVKSGTLDPEWQEYLKKSWRIQPPSQRKAFSEQRYLR